MPSANNPRKPPRPAAATVSRLQLLIDQARVFNTIRGIVADATAQTTYPATAVRRIRELYEAFDSKYPTAAKERKQ